MDNLPLMGLRALDLSRLLPGPYCTSMLSDLGCEVIKVEDPVLGDYYRELVPEAFASLNRDKKSVTLDLKKEEEKERFYQLVKSSDVLVESYRPGVTQRLGISYAVLSSIHPGLIYVSLTGYGQEGPYAMLPGHDINYFGAAGLLGYSGTEEQPYDIPSYMTIADLNASSFGLSAILVALLQRKETGKGQYIDLSITDCAVSWMGRYLNEPPRRKTDRANTPGYGVFLTSDGRYISLACIEEKFWQGLCRILGEDFAKRSRELPAAEVNGLIAESIKGRPLEHWRKVFGNEIPYGMVNDPGNLMDDPHLKERNLFFTDATGLRYVRYPVSFSGFSYRSEHLSAPYRGQHNSEWEDLLRSQ